MCYKERRARRRMKEERRTIKEVKVEIEAKVTGRLGN